MVKLRIEKIGHFLGHSLRTVKCYIHVDGNSCDTYRDDVDRKQVMVPDNTFLYDSRNQSQKALKALIKIRK